MTDKDVSGLAGMLQAATKAVARYRRAAESTLRPRGLTYAQYCALSALSERDALSQAELAAALETDSTTAMVLRGSLERKGYVDREPDATDGRIKRLALTHAGRAVLAAARPEIVAILAPAGGLFSDPELKRGSDILERLAAFAAEAETAASPARSDKGPRAKRGRPRKEGGAEPKAATAGAKKGRTASAETVEAGTPRRRGRPPKAAAPSAKAAAKAPAKASTKAARASKTAKAPKAAKGAKAPKAAARAKPAPKARKPAAGGKKAASPGGTASAKRNPPAKAAGKTGARRKAR